MELRSLNSTSSQLSRTTPPSPARYTYLMDLSIRHRRPLLLVGPTGTGKSAYVQNKLMWHLDPETFIPFFVTFSAQTTANQTQVATLDIVFCGVL